MLSVCFAFVIGASDCGFPQYDFVHASGGLGGSSSGVSGSDGGSGASGAQVTSGAAGVTETPGTSAGQSGSGGEAGVTGAAGAGGSPCVYPTPVTFLPHCVDGIANNGETGRDCGGADCVPCSGTEPCSRASDCVSNVCTSAKTCSPILSLTYMSIVSDAATLTPKFSLSIKYLDKAFTRLRSLRIRYYFNHNGVAEPILAHTQATYDPGNSQRNLASSELSYQIYRYPPGPADPNQIVTDSYLEITFPSDTSLTTNSTLNLTQDIVAGSSDPGAQFQQALNYSFLKTSTLVANRAITVYSGDQLLWGTPPPLTLLPDCAFAAGVNLNGQLVTSDGQALQASSDANVAYAGATYQNMAALVPPADNGTAMLLHTGFALAGASATWPMPNGTYWAYAWLTSDQSLSSGQLLIQGNPADKFVGVQQDSAFGWARMGPYSINLTRESVTLSATGTIDLAGVELYRAEP